MKKETFFKRIALGVVALAMTLTAGAQAKFHDVEANDAKGPVKKISVSGMMGNTQVTTFTQDGKMQREGVSDVVYDENGYMQSCKTTMQAMGESMEMNMKYTWKDGRIESQTISINGQDIPTKFTYDDKGMIVKQSISMMGQEMETPITDYKFDDHGNWISRSSSMMGQSITETRTIEYYE